MTPHTRTRLLRQTFQHVPDPLLASPDLSDLDLEEVFRSVIPGLIQTRARRVGRETDLVVLIQAARSSVPEFHEAAAGNARTPGSALIQILGVFYQPTPNSSAPRFPSRAIAFSEAPNLHTVALVAAHRHLSADALIQLARRKDPTIAAGVARNPQGPRHDPDTALSPS